MRWVKKGLVFTVTGQQSWMQSHAQVPTVDRMEDRWRVYFGTRDRANRSVITFVDVHPENPARVLAVHDRPVLDLGELGCFDDSGLLPTWIMDHGGLKWLYYIGINVGTTVPYRNSIGLAVSADGIEFRRKFSGPVVERTHAEPHLCASCCVLIEEERWRMWYLSGMRWEVRAGKPEPFYHIKSAESQDGINWERKGKVAIDLQAPDEGGLARPCVVRGPSGYRMWFCHRGAEDYRTNPRHTYRIGYAESRDGEEWVRNDSLAGIDVSETGWDSQMIAYPHVFEHNGKLYMFYNGNGFGASGFGYAVLEQE